MALGFRDVGVLHFRTKVYLQFSRLGLGIPPFETLPSHQRFRVVLFVLLVSQLGSVKQNVFVRSHSMKIYTMTGSAEVMVVIVETVLGVGFGAWGSCANNGESDGAKRKMKLTPFCTLSNYLLPRKL